MPYLAVETVPKVTRIFTASGGRIGARSGAILLPTIYDIERITSTEPLPAQGLQPGDLALFLSMQRRSFELYVSDVNTDGNGLLTNSDHVHAQPETFLSPYLMNLVSDLRPGELEQFGPDVCSVITHIGLRDL